MSAMDGPSQPHPALPASTARILAAATEYVLDHGIGDMSLRQWPARSVSPDATLLRHFSSKEDLLLQVIAKIRADFAHQLANDERTRAVHRRRNSCAHVESTVRTRRTTPVRELLRTGRRATRQGGRVAELAQATVDDWLRIVADQLFAKWLFASKPTLSPALLAQVRGLQLDLLLTGDRMRVDRAIEALIAMIDRTTN